MYKVEAVKIRGYRSNVPLDKVIEGFSQQLPKVGECYHIFGTNGDFMLITTAIQHVEHISNEYRFQTQNSVYTVIVKEEVK